MPVTRFAFEDKFLGWKLNEVAFHDFNLLVGGSGAGKTQILNAIRRVVHAGLVGTENVRECEWMIEVTDGDNRYQWEAKTGSPNPLLFSDEYDFLDVSLDEMHESTVPTLLHEVVLKNDEKLVNRNGKSFEFGSTTLPKLKRTESAISLLRDEAGLSSVYRAFSRFVFSEASALSHSTGARLLSYQSEDFDRRLLVEVKNRCRTIEELRQIKGVPLLAKAFILQENLPSEFNEIKEAYVEVFPTVSDIKLFDEDTEGGLVTADGSFIEEDGLSLGIKENGVAGWVIDDRISVGMRRTLMHFFEVALAAPGTVIIIDEVENSLGVNCLPQITDHFLGHTELQFILTSHHPYVINNIPWRYWKLVTRKGSEVTVKDATSIPELDAASKLEKFTQLMNLEEYEEAIA